MKIQKKLSECRSLVLILPFLLFCQIRISAQNNPFSNAYELGRLTTETALAKVDLAYGRYQKAYEVFVEASKRGIGEAYCFLGACYELGMGVSANQNLAWKYYNLASQRGNADGKAAVQRIQSSGYWTANDKTRKWFCDALKAQFNSMGSGIGGYVPNQGGSSSVPQNNGAKCLSCGGTGKCSMCKGNGGYWVNGIYTKTWTTCNGICNGTGICRGCNGKGVVY